MKLIVIMIISVFASDVKESATGSSESNILGGFALSSNLVKIEEDEYVKTKNSHYFGVSYNDKSETWRSQRWSKGNYKTLYNGSYKDEETAAHASDTLAKKLITNGEKGHKLNFPDNRTEVWAEKTSDFIGVTYNKKQERWLSQRWSKQKNTMVYNGTYKDEETAAHASDTLARKLSANGEKGHQLNFPDDNTEVCAKEKNFNYIGVNYNKNQDRWIARRWNENEKKMIFNGCYYKNERTAAHASDTLARKLMANGAKGYKINFPDDDTDVYPKNQNKKRKRPADFKNTQNANSSKDKYNSL